MSRLIIETVSGEPKTDKVFNSNFLPSLQLLVSVSQAEDGAPVTGLTKKNFQITNVVIPQIISIGAVADLADGFYRLTLKLKQGGKQVMFKENEPYFFGLRVKMANPRAQGQTVVRLISRNLQVVPDAGKK